MAAEHPGGLELRLLPTDADTEQQRGHPSRAQGSPAGTVSAAELSRNLLAGLTTSFAAIALGTAFGASTGRGALVGGLSAGVIPILTSTLGGTRIQVSGPTTPMSAVVSTVVEYSRSDLFVEVGLNATSPGCSIDEYSNAVCPVPDRFVTIVLLVCCVLLLLMAAFRVAQYITLVPNVVISGFQNGVALHMWHSQVVKLSKLRGSLWHRNFPVAAATTALCFALPLLTRRMLKPRVARVIPTTLCAIAGVSAICLAFADCTDCGGSAAAVGFAECKAECLEKTKLGTHVNGLADMGTIVRRQLPTWQEIQLPGLMPRALRFGLDLAVLCYIDTLLTSLVVDRMLHDSTRRNRELGAQGLANGVVALFGGLPGAQSTSRSVLAMQEGATMRLAGVATGLCVLVEVLLLQRIVALIPLAVFCGVLAHVGWKLFDQEPILRYLQANDPRSRKNPAPQQPGLVPATDLVQAAGSNGAGNSSAGSSGSGGGGGGVSHVEMAFISGTAVVTVVVSLNVAVGVFTLLFHVGRRLGLQIDDLEGLEEDGGESDDSVSAEGLRSSGIVDMQHAEYHHQRRQSLSTLRRQVRAHNRLGLVAEMRHSQPLSPSPREPTNARAMASRSVA